jgi:hypothetical protein
LTIREPLASRTLYRKDCTFPIIIAKLYAVIVPKIVFGEIAVQMLFGAMLIHAAHAPLED